VLLIDMAGADGRDPSDDYRQLLEELKWHDPALLDKPGWLSQQNGRTRGRGQLEKIQGAGTAACRCCPSPPPFARAWLISKKPSAPPPRRRRMNEGRAAHRRGEFLFCPGLGDVARLENPFPKE